MSTSASKEVAFNVVEGEERTVWGTNDGTVSQGELSRKMSCASICSTDGGEEDDDDCGDNEDEKSRHVVLGPQLALKEQLEKDKDDESLRKWKEQLLAGADLSEVGENPDPVVKILSITIITPGRPDLELPIPLVPNAKGYAFALKDGSRYRLKFSFTVSNNIVSGLRYTNIVWKTGVRVENKKVMLGTFSPQKEPYTCELEEETTPAGFFARGSYSAKTKFVDDDGKCYLDRSYCFEIRKDWP
ncbi:Rho GDP-dissociation inhibitor 1 [Apostasia shenzhenica]|uniref:Rho GDP-dissociation inhibitor 1 n=1 Tax=Apostasia shenzhenica TaxID=1088818 RepID=A0A2I0BE94_9ASPA|nr:Rho GDP-dissociation inhibitor 1 [Apostasia shenzhenica]